MRRAEPSVSVVDRVEDLSPEWLTHVLRAAGHDVRVRGWRSESVGTGQMAHNERIFLDYDPGYSPDSSASSDRAPVTDPAPATLVGKFPSPHPESRASGAAGGYRAEVRFYLDLAKDLAIRVPHCFYGALSEDASSFTLLLEDMAPGVQGDQIAGASFAQIEAAVVNLAGLHAPLWEDPRLEGVDWVPLGLNAGLAPLLEMATPAFVERFESRLSTQTKRVLRAFGSGFAAWAEGQPVERTLVHGDYRLDNQLFATTPGQDPVTTVDWQTISTGNGGRDLAFMLGNACSPEQRRLWEAPLLETYRQSMAALGVELSPEQVQHAYRHGSFQGPFITMLGALAVGQTERGDAMFMAMAERSAAQILDLDALALLG